jgi:hypothetical protein
VHHDQLNVHLEDPEQLAEVRLLTELIIAATESSGRLGAQTIDRLLGTGQ